MPNRIRRPRAEWRKLVAEHRASGLSAIEFAQRRGLSINTLRWWQAELREDPIAPRAVELVPVVRPTEFSGRGSPDRVEVELRLRDLSLVVRGLGPFEIAELARSLQAAGC